SDICIGTVEVGLVNNLLFAGDAIVPDVLVCKTPLQDSPTLELEKEQFYLFPACITTRLQ
ncbi:hypothetical protein SK128_018760, partial [Halocaridina rubra]